MNIEIKNIHILNTLDSLEKKIQVILTSGLFPLVTHSSLESRFMDIFHFPGFPDISTKSQKKNRKNVHIS